MKFKDLPVGAKFYTVEDTTEDSFLWTKIAFKIIDFHWNMEPANASRQKGECAGFPVITNRFFEHNQEVQLAEDVDNIDREHYLDTAGG